MKAIIIGAGLGGLTAAATLARRGIEITVLDVRSLARGTQPGSAASHLSNAAPRAVKQTLPSESP